MKSETKRRILYGEANYKAMVEENAYYVDKTPYIRLLERYKRPVFLRPRRFGKSLWCTMLSYYYDINEKDNFDDLFGRTAIGKESTPEHSSYMILSLDFSIIEPWGDINQIRNRFNDICNARLKLLIEMYKTYFKGSVDIDRNKDASVNLNEILMTIAFSNLPKLYIIIDEYDNFANQLITSHNDSLYKEITGDNSFLKGFFKLLKSGMKDGAIARTFITGVLPITIDDLSSGYNIAEFITLEKEFEAMLGFTQNEMDNLLDAIYEEHEIEPATRKTVMETIKNNYNGYHIVDPCGEALYNSTIVMFFLRKFIDYKEIPEYLIDINLKTDISWVNRLTNSNPERTEELVNGLLIENRINYNKTYLLEKFSMSQFFEKDFYPISFYYLGMLTKEDDQYMCLPNLNMKSIFTDYFNDIHKIDVTTHYAEIMRSFIERPDIPQLFGDYWRVHISQLPEAIFQQVNENFYRTTFFELCRQHLSAYFTWAVEKSRSTGRTDLEFIGKYNTKMANIRFLLEFKYYSNAKWNKIKASIPGNNVDGFQATEEDIKQINAYQKEWKTEHPEADNKSFLVYCFGNQGFKVFQM